MALKWVSKSEYVGECPAKSSGTMPKAGSSCSFAGSTYNTGMCEWTGMSEARHIYMECVDDDTGGGTIDPGTTSSPGRITVNGSTAYSKHYEIKKDMSTTNMGMSRITGSTWLSNSFVSTKSNGTQIWIDGSSGEGISVTTPSGLRIYYGGSLLTLVEGSSVVSPKERYKLLSGTASNITLGSYFLTAGDTQQAYILLQGGGGGGGKGGGWGLRASAKDGGGGGGGAGGLILVKYILGRNTKYNFTVGSGGSGATGSGGTGGSGGTSSFGYDGQNYRAWAYGGSGGKGKSGAAAEGGTGGTTEYHSTTQRMAYLNGPDGGGSQSAGKSSVLSNLTSLTNTFGFTYKTGTGTMSTFRNSAASYSGGTSSGDNNHGQAGGGGSSLYAFGGSATKTSAIAGGTGAGGAGGTSKNGGGGPSGAAGGAGFVYVYF